MNLIILSEQDYIADTIAVLKDQQVISFGPRIYRVENAISWEAVRE